MKIKKDAPQSPVINETLPLLYEYKQSYRSDNTTDNDTQSPRLHRVGSYEKHLNLRTNGLASDHHRLPRQRSYSWPQIHKADFIELTPKNSNWVDEHILIPAGHMALVEGWHVGLSKAAVVLGLQALINAIPLWLALRGELGEKGPPDWSDTKTVMQAFAWSAFADWGANITDTLYLQGLRSQLHALPNWAQEFVASNGTCVLDTILTTPLFFFKQKAIVNPELSLLQVLTSSSFKEVYAGANALLVNNLGFMNVFYPLNELTIRATKSEHNALRQVMIGILASLVASTVAWPAEWLRAQQSLPEHEGESAWEIFKAIHYSIPTIFSGFPALLFAAVSGGIFTGLANKYMRRLPPQNQEQAQNESLSSETSTERNFLQTPDASPLLEPYEPVTLDRTPKLSNPTNTQGQDAQDNLRPNPFEQIGLELESDLPDLELGYPLTQAP